MRFHEIQHRLERVRPHDGIGIKQQDVSPPRQPDRLVVRARKADVLRVADEPHFGKPRRDRLRTAVRRGVVDDDHFEAVAGVRPQHRFDGVRGEFARVVGDDDDGEVHRFHPKQITIFDKIITQSLTSKIRIFDLTLVCKSNKYRVNFPLFS